MQQCCFYEVYAFYLHNIHKNIYPMKSTKTLKNVLLLAAMASAVGLFSRCSNDDESGAVDVTAPSIEVADPANGEYLVAGDHLHFEATFTDDVELAVYNINIHNSFDGHSHGRVAGRAEDLVKWSLNENFTIPAGNKTYEVHLDDEIQIPANTMAGPYHFIVTAIDAAGNATSYQNGSTVELAIVITNDQQAVVEITNLENGELEIEVDEVFVVEGTITDPEGESSGIHSVEIVLGESHEDDHHSHGRKASSESFIDLDLEEEELEAYMTDGAIILEQIFTEINFVLSQEQLDELSAEDIDHLELVITVHDEQGNITISKTSVHIHAD